MEIEILDGSGAVINTIIADASFADEFYPNSWREKAKPEPEPIPQPITLDEAKAAKVVEIKAEAGRRITALDWRLQRAQEREQLGEAGFETVTDVLVMREQIRQASNAAERAVATLVSVEDVLAFTW